VGITQPGGPGTVIILYDDNDATNHAAGSPHTWAEIAASPFAADFVSNTANVPQYKALQSVQLGNGANTTSLVDATDSCVTFANTKTLTFGGTSTARFLTLGTKIGTGNSASGINGGTLDFGATTSLIANVKLYGAKLKQTVGVLSWSHGFGYSNGEACNCLFQSAVTGTQPSTIGSAGGSPIDNIYNCTFSYATTSQMIANFFVSNCERVTFSAASPLATIQAGSPNVTMKDVVVVGTPTVADFRWAAAGAVDWRFVRPIFSGNAPKFARVTGGGPSLTNPTWEMWSWDVKVVDRNGAAIANIPVTLTDVDGVVLVNTTTDSSGAVTYGSGITAGFVPVVDHWLNGTTYAQHHRSPFTVNVNVGASKNANYLSRTYKFYWPHYETYTTSSGQLEDLSDVVALEDQSGAPTSWVELALP